MHEEAFHLQVFNLGRAIKVLRCLCCLAVGSGFGSVHTLLCGEKANLCRVSLWKKTLKMGRVMIGFL